MLATGAIHPGGSTDACATCGAPRIWLQLNGDDIDRERDERKYGAVAGEACLVASVSKTCVDTQDDEGHDGAEQIVGAGKWDQIIVELLNICAESEEQDRKADE